MEIFHRFLLSKYSSPAFAVALLAFSVNADANTFGNTSYGTNGVTQPVLLPKKSQPVLPVKPLQPVHQVTPQKNHDIPVPKALAAGVLHSANVLKLKTDVAALNSNLDKYIKAGNKVDLDLTVVIAGIDMVAIMNTDLTNIDQDSALVRDLLGIAKQVPELKDQASMLLSALEKAKPSVKQAQKSTSETNARLIPIRNKLNTLDKAVRSLVSTAGTLEKALGLYSTVLVKTEQCAEGLPPGSPKDSLLNNIDHQASDVDPYVVKANNGLVDIINVINSIEQSIQSDTRQVIEPIHKLEQEVDALERKIHAVINPLHELAALMKKEFSAEFPYPSPTWKNPIRIKHYNFNISFKVILQGEHAIEKEIEKILSKDMYKAAKIFGLEKLVKDVEHEAKKELNSIKGKMSLNIKMEIPGLDHIKADLDAFERELANIHTPDINAQPIDDLLKKIQGDIPKWNSMLNNCTKK